MQDKALLAKTGILLHLRTIIKLHHIHYLLLESNPLCIFFFPVKEITNLQKGKRQGQRGILNHKTDVA